MQVKQVNMYEAKTHFSQLVKCVATGENKEIVIANRGTPMAKIVPYEKAEERKIGVAEGKYNIPSTVEEFDSCNDEIAAMFGLSL